MGGAQVICLRSCFFRGKGDAFPLHVHKDTHEGILVLDGKLELTLDGERYLLISGDYANIPAGNTAQLPDAEPQNKTGILHDERKRSALVFRYWESV